jgi:flagellar basal body-associated protein FliL
MEEKKKTKNKGLKVLMFGMLAILIVAAILVGVFYWYVNSKLDKINYVEIPIAEIEINEGVEEVLTGYRNIAIFGVDGYTEAGELSR